MKKIEEERAKVDLDNLLINVGILPNKKAFQYLKDKINRNKCHETNVLYNQIVRSNGASIRTVDRSIRAAIVAAHSGGKLEKLNTILGCKICDRKEYPSNKVFIRLLSEFLYGNI